MGSDSTAAATAIDVSVKAVQQEASRLVAAGLITDRRRGNLRLLRAVGDSVVSKPLTDLMAATYGPLPVLSGILAELPEVEDAYIYGSWAARYAGESGAVPHDVDVLAVGTVDPDVLHDAAASAEQRLRRPVSIRQVRPETWRDPDPADPFLASVRSRPLVRLRL